MRTPLIKIFNDLFLYIKTIINFNSTKYWILLLWYCFLDFILRLFVLYIFFIRKDDVREHFKVSLRWLYSSKY